MDNSFNFFDKIFCINLAHRSDRWINCQKVFKNLKIEKLVERYEGINMLEKNKIDGLFNSYFLHQEPNHIDIINLRRSGCAYSFIQLIQLAKEYNFKNVLIFEDDVTTQTDSETIFITLENCINELPQNWEMFYLSANPTNFHGHHMPVTNYSPNLCTIHAAFCCHAVAINSCLYDQIINSYMSYPDIFSWVLQNVNFDTYCVNKVQPNGRCFMPKKLLFNQVNNFSDIENCIRPNCDIIKQTYQTYSHILIS